MSEKGIEALRNGQNSFIGGCSSSFPLFFCRILGLFGNAEHRFPAIDTELESRYILIEHADKKTLEKQLDGKIIKTPGHTSCSISLLHNTGVLFCGDAAMNNFPSKHRIIIWVGDKEDFYNSWQKIIVVNPTIIYPAHGKPFPTKDLKRFLRYIRKIKQLPLK